MCAARTVDGRVEALVVDEVLLLARGDERGLVAHVGDLGAREAGRERREARRRRLGGGGELERAEVHLWEEGGSV